MTAAAADMDARAAGLGLFEKWLSVWVGGAILANEMRFGLYEIDYTSQKRTLREGSKAYVEIVKRHGNT